MTEQSRHWDGVSLGDATYAPYSALKWAEQERLSHGQGASFPNYGILAGTGDGTYPPLRVQAKSPASTNIEVEVGVALVHGYLYENTAALTLTVGANASGNPRIDTVVLRADFVAQTVRAVIKQGTPAGSPARVTLQQDTSVWEIPLADIAVANGFSTISNSNITDRRRSVQGLTAGWMPYAFPMNYQPGGNYDGGSIGVGQNQGIAVPIQLTGNMSLQDVVFRGNQSGVGGYDLNWALYVQDVNDQNTAENTVRQVATGTGSGATTGLANYTIPATSSGQYLSPGQYWLVMRNNGGNSFGLGRITANAIESGTYLLHAGATLATPLAQTFDLVTGWAASGALFGIILRGWTLGRATAP